MFLSGQRTGAEAMVSLTRPALTASKGGSHE
jgi:hypothetical protein